MSGFQSWLTTFIEEKGIDLEQYLAIEGPSGTNMMPVGVVVDAMNQTGDQEQAQIKNTLIVIDFKNGDPLHYIRHLAQAIAQ